MSTYRPERRAWSRRRLLTVSMPSISSVLVFVLFIVVASFGAVDGGNYCKICPNHTLCKFKDISPRCSEVGSTTLDKLHREEILREHNRLRRELAYGKERRGAHNSVQPPASNMRKMEWDEELAKVAAAWARQCNYGHDACRDVERFPVGQNVAIRWTTNPKNDWEWTTVIQSWYDEVTIFKPKDIEPFQFHSETGHYTQIAWADTWLVGCANIYYKDRIKHYRYYICNYGPGGNEISLPVGREFPGYVFPKLYKIGTACSECPKDTQCCPDEPGLCCRGIATRTTSQQFDNSNTIPPYYPSNPSTTTIKPTTKRSYHWLSDYTPSTTQKPNITISTTRIIFKFIPNFSTTPKSLTASPENPLKVWLSYFTPRTNTSNKPTETTTIATTTTSPITTNKTPRTPLDIYSFFKIY